MKTAAKTFTFITVGTILGVSSVVGGLSLPAGSVSDEKITNIAAPQTYTVPETVIQPELPERGTYEVVIPPPEVQRSMVASNDATAFTTDESWEVQWPFPVGVHISSGFGSRIPPCEGCSGEHGGTDFAIGEGTPVQPIAKGTVIAVGWDGAYGYRVVIEHIIDGRKVLSLYGHLLENSSPLKPGDSVRTGDFIGEVGSTGKSTGNHLHLEITINGVKQDPQKWLEANAGVAKTE